MSLAAYETTWENERKGYIRCRAVGHSWHDYDSNWEPMYGFPLTLRCERCGTERRDSVGTSGQLLNRHYVKPDDYDLGRDDFKPTRSDFRLMLLAVRGDIEVPPVKQRKAAAR